MPQNAYTSLVNKSIRSIINPDSPNALYETPQRLSEVKLDIKLKEEKEKAPLEEDDINGSKMSDFRAMIEKQPISEKVVRQASRT